MASEQEMMADLATADAAGDTELAQHIAGQIKAARGAPTVGTGEAALRGAAQGATLGYSDELKGATNAAAQKNVSGRLGLATPSDSFGTLYKRSRDSERAQDSAARTQHPMLYGGAEMAGSMLPLLASGGQSKTAATALGVAQGLGYSNADSAGGLARDSALGGLVGRLGYSVGQKLGSAGQRLSDLVGRKTAAATARAGTQAAEEVGESVATAAGSLGSEVQKGNRIVENIRRITPSDLTPEEQAAMEKLEARLMASNRQALPTQAEIIAAKDAELASLKAGAEEATASRKAELLKPQIGADVASFAKSYGEPLAAAALAPAGLKPAAAILFGRTRAGKAIMSRATRPGNQIALLNAANSVGQKGTQLLRLLIQGSTPVATQYLAGGTE